MNRHIPLLSLSLLATTLGFSEENYGDLSLTPTCENGSHSALMSASQTEGKGIGYGKGYTSLDLFWIPQYTSTIFPFIDLRGHLFDNGPGAANAGFGIRGLVDSAQIVWGANIFYDYREASHANFQQIGVGVETFFGQWNFHLNGYVPIGLTERKYSSHHYQFSMGGADAAIGRGLFKTKYIEMHAKVGGYYFQGHFGKNTGGGGLIGLTAEITPYLTLAGQASYDPLFKGIVQGSIALNLPFGKKSRSNTLFSCNTSSMQRVDRFEIIVADKKKR